MDYSPQLICKLALFSATKGDLRSPEYWVPTRTSFGVITHKSIEISAFQMGLTVRPDSPLTHLWFNRNHILLPPRDPLALPHESTTWEYKG